MSMEICSHFRPAHHLTTLIDVQLERIRKERDVPSQHYELCGVHVGAFNGKIDQELIEKHKPMICHCIEPQFATFRQLRIRTIRSNSFRTYHIAIHPNLDEVTLYRRRQKGPDQASSIFCDFIQSKQAVPDSYKVKAMDLSAFCKKEEIQRIDMLRINCEGGEFDLFRRGNLSFLSFTNVIAIALHGKRPVFLTDNHNQLKVHITETIRKSGFDLIYGWDFTKHDKAPASHVWQLWVRERWL